MASDHKSSSGFHHALKVKQEVCIGCTHCMTVCPTEAIRVKDGMAVITDDRCVDCGMCLRSCPVKAIHVDHDDFNHIFDYKYRIALVPAVLIGQFPEDISVEQIYSVLADIGFTHVYEAEHGVDLLHQTMLEYVKKPIVAKPVISSFCPAIVRLIQVRFPALTENVMLLKPPLDVASLYIKKRLVDEGALDHEIGIFYITPCAAKIAAIKSPVGEDVSAITGVINLDFIFNKIYRTIKATPRGSSFPLPDVSPLTGIAVKWSLTHGEADHIPGRSLAIDEIHNVMDFLEKIENEEISDIDFLELRACDESCAGGVLTTANRFLTVERLNHRASETIRRQTESGLAANNQNEMAPYFGHLLPLIRVDEVQPRSIMQLDKDMAEAMRKMNKRNKVYNALPKVDCGACGAPSCQALAEDIAQEKASFDQCFFIRNRMLTAGKIQLSDSKQILDSIWGNNKIKKLGEGNDPTKENQ